MGKDARNLSSGISLVASLDMILSNKRITKPLIRPRRCAGWSAPLFFSNPEDRFSRFEVHMMYNLSIVFRLVYA